jgi:HIP---CoA ligase
MTPQTIPHVAKAAAARFGDAPALLESGETWSFNTLWEQARKATSAFIAHGTTKGDRIAIWAPNCREWIIAAIGAQIAGAAVVPLNTRLKGREAGDIMRRTSATMLFTVGDFLGTNYPALLRSEDIPTLGKTICFDADWQGFLAGGSAINPEQIDTALAALSADDISDIMFTSGTTGSPKGVMMTHGRVLPQFENWIKATGLAAGERYLIVNPFFHSFGFKAGWVACLMAGAVIVPMPVFDAAKAARVIEEQRIAFMPGAPTIFQALLAEKQVRPFDSSSLRGGTTGAAVVPPILIERIRNELGMKDIITAYGMTECTNITACKPGDPVERIANTCGCAIPGHEVRIVGGDGQEVARGEPGEIVVRGYGVMLGYLDDADATAETIDSEGWLHTGDIGTMDADGYVRITDRMKDMYISGGFNVYPAEVEKLLAGHPAVGQSAVVGMLDERMGEVGKAYVVLRPGAVADESGIIAWCRENMANYKVPRSVVFVEGLPLNAAGKVLKTELRG